MQARYRWKDNRNALDLYYKISQSCPQLHRKIDSDPCSNTSARLRLMLQHSDLKLVVAAVPLNYRETEVMVLHDSLTYQPARVSISQAVVRGLSKVNCSEMLMIYSSTGFESSPDDSTTTYFYA